MHILSSHTIHHSFIVHPLYHQGWGAFVFRGLSEILDVASAGRTRAAFYLRPNTVVAHTQRSLVCFNVTDEANNDTRVGCKIGSSKLLHMTSHCSPCLWCPIQRAATPPPRPDHYHLVSRQLFIPKTGQYMCMCLVASAVTMWEKFFKCFCSMLCQVHTALRKNVEVPNLTQCVVCVSPCKVSSS